jgi:hypothetical protein
MDADHVTAWSKVGATDAANCKILCKTPTGPRGIGRRTIPPFLSKTAKREIRPWQANEISDSFF